MQKFDELHYKVERLEENFQNMSKIPPSLAGSAANLMVKTPSTLQTAVKMPPPS